MRYRLLLALAPIALLACSGTDTSTSTSSSSGGPSTTAPEGAINMEIYSTVDQSCPLGNVHVDLGNSKINPPELVTDGYEGAGVTCSVVPDGSGGFAAQGTLKKGELSFTFKDLSTSGSSATGTVVVKDPSGKGLYTSDPKSPCVFQFAPGTGQSIDAGKVWIQFDCSRLVSDADPTKTCSSRYGYVLVDRCTSK